MPLQQLSPEHLGTAHANATMSPTQGQARCLEISAGPELCGVYLGETWEEILEFRSQGTSTDALSDVPVRGR